MSQRVQKLLGFIIEGAFACRKHNSDIVSFFVYLMNKKCIYYILGNVTLLITIVHKAWKVAIYLPFISCLMGDESIRSHFIADRNVLDNLVGSRSKLNIHITSFRHYSVKSFVFLQKMN